MKQEDFNSDKFRDDRYIHWGNSWEWSYWLNARYKADFINKFIKEHGIDTAVEIGCWDWANLWMYDVFEYTWYDVSYFIIEKCKDMYKNDNWKRFFVNDDNTKFQKAELSLCLDVLYHIFPQDRFEKMIDKVIEAWEKYVIIYTKIRISPREDWSCINDYDFLWYLDKKWYKYEIEPSSPPASVAKFITIYK